MAKQKRAIRRRRAIKPAVEEVEEEDVLDEEEELEEEDEELEDEDELDDEDEDEDDEPTPAPVSRKRAAKPVTSTAKPQAVKEAAAMVAAEFNLGELLEGMVNGQAILITRKSSKQWHAQFTDGIEAAPSGPRLRGKEYWDKVLTPEYVEWQTTWGELDPAGKVKAAKKAKAKWDEHETEMVNIMRAGEAYRKVVGIEKYKPEYRSASVRRELRGK